MGILYKADSCSVTGTGASCVYPLLGAKLNGWRFLATEIDEEAVRFASENVSRNGLSDRITGMVSVVTQFHTYRIAGNFRWRNFCELVKIRFLRIARFCSTKGRHAPNFAEKTFAYSHKTAKFAKFSPSKVFCYTVSPRAFFSLPRTGRAHQS